MAGLAAGLVRGMRPHQWTKNVLVLAAPLAAGVIFEQGVLVETLIALAAFCLASGGTYLINDANDVEADRLHPRKRHRPVASGAVPVPVAYGFGVASIVAAAAMGFLVAVPLGATIAGYVVLTTTYSLWLKRVAVVDLVAVSAGFVLRAVAGAAATDVPISPWFFIVASGGALLMVTGKREAELASADGSSETRAVLSQYTRGFLASVRTVATTMALMAYCLWAFEPGSAISESGLAVGSVAFQLSIAPFGLAVLRYSLLIDAGEGEEPERLVLKDRTLLVAGALWAIIYGYGVYVA
jgi:decaprenyl-phosphate phosphoribosyltransferase